MHTDDHTDLRWHTDLNDSKQVQQQRTQMIKCWWLLSYNGKDTNTQVDYINNGRMVQL